jgi:hypothetical protein
MFDTLNFESSPPGYYYPYDFDDDDYNYENCLSLGLGDFLFFNLLILSIQCSFWLTSTKIYVLLGSIVIIQIGHYCMRIVQRLWNESCMPALPFSVIPFSAYVIIIDNILYCATTKCTNV